MYLLFYRSFDPLLVLILTFRRRRAEHYLFFSFIELVQNECFLLYLFSNCEQHGVMLLVSYYPINQSRPLPFCKVLSNILFMMRGIWDFSSVSMGVLLDFFFP